MKNYTRIVESGRHLQYEEMVEAANQMFSEEVDVEELATFLVALSRKGETAKRGRGHRYGNDVPCSCVGCSGCPLFRQLWHGRRRLELVQH